MPGAISPAPVSVVVPCYRCKASIRSAIASVHSQTLPAAEVILVDDGSGDGTLEILEELASAYAPGWIRVIALGMNCGPSRARNRGWEASTQPYLAFLDADDSWHPRKLELQFAAIRADPTIALLGHRADIRQVDTAPAPLLLPGSLRFVGLPELLLRNPFPTPSVLLRRDLPFRFDEGRRRVEDYLLWAQIVLTGHRAAVLDLALAHLHKPAFGSAGLSGDIEAMYQAGREVRNQLAAAGLLTPVQAKVAHAIAALKHARRRVILQYCRYRAPRPSGVDREPLR